MKLLLFSWLLPVYVWAQMPETDVWLFKISKKEGKYAYSNPLNISNRTGYDNQPVFSADDKSVLYVSVDSTKQADIYQYSISKKTTLNLTKSDVSEYSPTLLPREPGFSCVVVEKDSAQRLWKFGSNGNFDRIIDETIDSVGYFTWLNADTLLYYKLTEPHSLKIIDLKSKTEFQVCEQPSRAFKAMGSKSRFMYAVKYTDKTDFWILDPSTRQSNMYTTYPSTNEDFIFHEELGLIKSENADLLRYNAVTKTWENLFSFASVGIKKITRFNFDSKTNQLVVVSNL